jgi:hypothetical protein
VGVVAGSTEFGCFLTPEVRAAIPAAVEAVRREVEAMGVPVPPRTPPRPPDLWWEKAVPA